MCSALARVQPLSDEDEIWEQLCEQDPAALVGGLEPGDNSIFADSDRLDRIAEGFSEVIDAKSLWTFCHSRGVAELSVGIGRVLGLSSSRLQTLNRAALLHDIGKLGVSNTILDKPGKLDPNELAIMRNHPRFTYEILGRVRTFSGFAEMAAGHHERIDGKGYHRGVSSITLPQEARIIAVADMYEALASKRPYRQDLSEGEVMTILEKNSGDGICPQILSALQAFLSKDGLTPIRLAA